MIERWGAQNVGCVQNSCVADRCLSTHEDEEKDTEKRFNERSMTDSVEDESLKPNVIISPIQHTPSKLRYSHQKTRISHSTTRYTRLLNEQVAASIDKFELPGYKALPFQGSSVLNSQWTPEEKETFFTAMARCGKGNLPEVSRRIGTKSLAEVTTYVGVLDEEVLWRKHESGKQKYFDMTKIPAAMEVDDKWLLFEERTVSEMVKKSQKGVSSENNVMDGEDMIFNKTKASELAEWYFSILR
jgi:hypothetical protein